MKYFLLNLSVNKYKVKIIKKMLKIIKFILLKFPKNDVTSAKTRSDTKYTIMNIFKPYWINCLILISKLMLNLKPTLKLVESYRNQSRDLGIFLDIPEQIRPILRPRVDT